MYFAIVVIVPVSVFPVSLLKLLKNLLRGFNIGLGCNLSDNLGL